MATQEELRRNITNQIVEALKSGGIPPWKRPWGISPNSGFPSNAVSKRKYSGVNVILLRMAAMSREWSSKWWATYPQWTSMGGQVQHRPENVQPGCWGTKIIFFTKVSKIETDPVTGEEEETSFPVLKTYTIFNVDQVDGPFDHLRVKDEPLNPHFVDYEPAEEVIRNSGADVRLAGDHAVYNRQGDFILCPPKHRFEHENDYYATVLHELSHWTAHESRLNRVSKHNRFGDKGYAEEELVAELSSCFTLATLGVPQSDDMSNHNAYCQSWIRLLQDDAHAVLRVASAASKASDFILAFAPKPEPEPAEVPF